MLYTYKELLEKYNTQYNIAKMISRGELYQVGIKIYSEKSQTSKLAILAKRYPDAIITMNSAFYYHSLTDDIPDKCYMVSKRNGTKIKDPYVIQTFESADTFSVGKETLEIRDAVVNIYSKERMLIELVRNKNKLPFDYYKEIISGYRKIVDKLDTSSIEEYAEMMYHGAHIMETIQMEVF